MHQQAAVLPRPCVAGVGFRFQRAGVGKVAGFVKGGAHVERLTAGGIEQRQIHRTAAQVRRRHVFAVGVGDELVERGLNLLFTVFGMARGDGAAKLLAQGSLNGYRPPAVEHFDAAAFGQRVQRRQQPFDYRLAQQNLLHGAGNAHFKIGGAHAQARCFRHG